MVTSGRGKPQLTNSDTSDTNPLLQNLKPDDKLHASTDMQFTRAPSPNLFGHDIPEHVEVAVDLPGLLLELGHVSDVLEFRLGQTVFIFTPKSSEDVTRLFVTTNLDQPAR